MRWINRWQGGVAVALAFLRARSELRPGASATLLDVGTGTADIPLLMEGWARRRGVDLQITATDLSAEVLGAARGYLAGKGAAVRLERADALALPYPDASFDYVTCSMALHHFAPADAVRVLRELDRVARRAVLVSDLARSRVAYWGARLLFGLLLRDPMVRYDAPLSVLRAYTAPELRALARQAGLPDARVRSRPLFRLELVVEKPGG